jgi:hypothetical protein
VISIRSCAVVLVTVLPGAAVQPGTVVCQESPAPDSGPITLRLGGATGRVLSYAHVNRLSLGLPDELGGRATTRTSLRLDQKIESRGRDSVVVFSELREFQFDVDPRPEELPDLSRLEGLRFRFTATPAGRIYRIEIEGAGGPVQKQFREQVETWLRGLGFPALPPGPARIGDSWTDSARVPLAALLGLQAEAEAIEVRTTTLADVDLEQGAPIAQLDVETRWTDDPESTARQLTVHGASSQTVRFDVRQGVFVDSRGTSRMRVEINAGKGEPPLAIEAEGSYETRLLEPDL